MLPGATGCVALLHRANAAERIGRRRRRMATTLSKYIKNEWVHSAWMCASCCSSLSSSHESVALTSSGDPKLGSQVPCVCLALNKIIPAACTMSNFARRQRVCIWALRRGTMRLMYGVWVAAHPGTKTSILKCTRAPPRGRRCVTRRRPVFKLSMFACIVFVLHVWIYTPVYVRARVYLIILLYNLFTFIGRKAVPISCIP